MFTEKGIQITGIRELFLDAQGCLAQMDCREDRVLYRYEGQEYALCTIGGTVTAKGNGFSLLSSGQELTLFPEKP